MLVIYELGVITRMENFGNMRPMSQPPTNVMPSGKMPKDFLPPTDDFSNQDYHVPNKGRKSGKVVLAFVILTLVAASGFGVWYWLKSDKTAETVNIAGLGGDDKVAGDESQIATGMPESDNEKVDTPEVEEENSEEETKTEQPTETGQTEQPAQPVQPVQSAQPVQQPKPDEQKEVVTISLEANGAEISSEKVMCEKADGSCKLKLPVITRKDWEVVGWAETKNATTAKYKSGEEISASQDRTLYAVTRKKNTVNFNKNGATGIGAASLSCTMYNVATSCSIMLPSITKAGWNILGWSEDANAHKEQYYVSSSANVSDDKDLYAITSKKITVNSETNGAEGTKQECIYYNTEIAQSCKL